jgi:hypothetical protein
MPSGLTTVLAIFASVVGLYGAILSTINAYWRWRDRHSQIRIRLHKKIEIMPDKTNILIAWQAQNIGTNPVTLIGAGLLLPNEIQYRVSGLSTGSAAFPHVIVPGQYYILHTLVETLVHDLQENGLSGTVRFTGFGNSAIGETFKGGNLRLNLASGELVQGKDNRIWGMFTRIGR